MKSKPSKLTEGQMQKLPHKRLKAYRGKLMDYRREENLTDEDQEWLKQQIYIARNILKGD